MTTRTQCPNESRVERIRTDPGQQTLIDQRAHRRFPMVKSLVAIPVSQDGVLDTNCTFDGLTSDVSQGGLGLELNTSDPVPYRSFLVGIETEDGGVRCAGVSVRYAAPSSRTGFRCGTEFGGMAQQILSAEGLTHRFDRQSMTYRLPFDPNTYAAWQDAGVLKPVLLDVVQVCPKCYGLPTVRRACGACRSARVTSDKLIHHFACAHVDFIHEFEQSDGLLCPKCRTDKLIVGSDFEYLAGQFRCLDCSWVGSELEEVGHCLRCDYRFSLNEAYEQELVSYHVERLDPLALVAAGE